MVELLPSILSADFAHLAEQVAAAERGGGTVIHVDVMDGHFVPNITMGPPVVKSLRKATKLPLDCHLMIENPDEFIPAFADAGADWVSVHYEACRHLHRTLELIAQQGMKPGVVINPATRVDFLLEILPMVHHVLVMSVNPGFGGQKFIPFSLEKMRNWVNCARSWGCNLESKWTAAWLTRPCPGRPSRCGAAGGRECRIWRRRPGAGCARTAGRGPTGCRQSDRSKSHKKYLNGCRQAFRRRPRPPMRGYESVVVEDCRCAFLRVFALTAVAAQAKDKKPKKKKNDDLSANPLANVNSKQPDKELYDKAMIAMKKGHFDVARLDLQTLLNTYPESEYQMRAKLAVGDSWFKEGGTAALTQAEAEYKDFMTFFPNAPEAAEAQMKVADIYYQQMEKPDRDYNNVKRAEQEYRNMINQFPDSALVPRAKQKLREVQEVMAEREAQIGFYYASRENFTRHRPSEDGGGYLSALLEERPGLLGIGDAYEGEAQRAEGAQSARRCARASAVGLLDKAAAAYAKVITRYPMAPHVEDARDRLVPMNRPVPEPTRKPLPRATRKNGAARPVRFTDKTLDIIKHGPRWWRRLMLASRRWKIRSAQLRPR